MASNITRRIAIKRADIRGLRTPEDIANWLDKFTKELDKWTATVYDHIENGGLGTPNWNIRQAREIDVVDGNAKVIGNLLIEHKTTGTKHEFEA